MESYVYDPFLSDELMDSSLNEREVWFDLGMPLFAKKESPSHESDSGWSDMSEENRSVSADIVDIMSPVVSEDDVIEMLDFDSVLYKDDELDKELAGYLCNTPVLDKAINGKTVEQHQSAPPVVSSPEIDVDSDSNDPDYVPEKRIIQARALRPRPEPVKIAPKAEVIRAPPCHSAVLDNPDIRILQGRSSNVPNTAGTSKQPAVKVVKVIKTAAQTKSEIDNELMKALDDRNKKNAIQAKINREKKKAYMKSLEDEIEELKCENRSLKISNEKHIKENQALHDEVDYLKSVLANQSALAGLLKNIGSVSGVKMSSSIGRKRNIDSDHDYTSAPVKKLKIGKTAGVCLHVDDGNVSLEFCSKCATMSKNSSADDNC